LSTSIPTAIPTQSIHTHHNDNNAQQHTHKVKQLAGITTPTEQLRSGLQTALPEQTVMRGCTSGTSRFSTESGYHAHRRAGSRNAAMAVSGGSHRTGIKQVMGTNTTTNHRHNTLTGSRSSAFPVLNGPPSQRTTTGIRVPSPAWAGTACAATQAPHHSSTRGWWEGGVAGGGGGGGGGARGGGACTNHPP